MIIDQLPSDAFREASAILNNIHHLGNLSLDYLPRTTPCGHATISLGVPPSEHRIQGREWCETKGGQCLKHDIEALAISQFDDSVNFDSEIQEGLQRSALLCKIRERHPDSSLVAVAAKAMIPFLTADVSVFPTSVVPVRRSESGRPSSVPPPSRGDPYSFVVRLFAGTDAGRRLLQDPQTQAFLNKETENLSSFVEDSRVELYSDAASVLDAHWVLPQSWNGYNRITVIDRWRNRVVLPHGPRIDEYYTTLGKYLLDRLAGRPQLLVQSWFSTDFAGHHYGVTSAQYGEALSRALRQASQLATSFIVVGTSDHGGRDTPHHLLCDFDRDPCSIRNRNNLVVQLPQANHVFLSGDHVVGWGDNSNDHGVRLLQCSWSPELQPVIAEASILERSFHPTQRPLWLLLPGVEERYVKRMGKSPAGGDHGAYAYNGVVGTADNEVPLFSTESLPGLPKTLEQFTDWVLGIFAQLEAS
jgi:hypothetical protein